MTYPGNPALAADVQERLRTTFLQSLDLAESGKRQEAILGCDFILGLDPQFELARTLRTRLASDAGAIGVDDLRLALEPVPDWGTGDRLLGDDDGIAPGAAEVPDAFAGLGELPPLDDDFGSLPPLDTLGGGLATAPANLGAELESLIAARRLSEALDLAGRNQLAVMGDPTLAALAQRAQALAEAAPFVDQFLAAAEAARERGDETETGRMLEKIRALDPDHPALARLAAAAPGIAQAPAGEVELEGFDLADEPAIELAPLEDEVASPAAGDLFDSPLMTQPVAPSPPAAGGDQRIQDLLDEGQAAFERRDFQGAIDAWSRIFLIDIDSEEASERIEQARRMKAELERRVEEVFQGGLGALERGDSEAAEAAFRQVLELSPAHLQAKEYLQQLAAGVKPTPPPRREKPASAETPLLAGLDEHEADLKEEILVPPEPGAERKRGASAGPVIGGKAGRTARRNFILIGAVVLVALGAGGWYVFTHRSQLFPNAEPAAPVAAPESDALARAEKLHQEGKTAVAIAQLKRMPPGTPQYERAQQLIAEWEKALAPAAPPAEESEEHKKLVQALELARDSHAEGQLLRARDVFKRLQAIEPLGAEDAALLADAEAKLAPFAAELELIANGEIERALPSLWRRLEAEPADAVAKLIVVTCYYNLAIADLQRGSPRTAAEKLREALALHPDDAVMQRHLQLADTYATRGQDLLYRTYVKYLAPR